MFNHFFMAQIAWLRAQADCKAIYLPLF